MRLTSVGDSGTVAVSETARLTGRTLRSEVVVVGELKPLRVETVGPLRERIRVGSDGTLSTEGRFSFRTQRNRRVPVRYVHYYESTRFDRTTFGRYRGREFQLRASYRTRRQGKKLWVSTRSTLRPA